MCLNYHHLHVFTTLFIDYISVITTALMMLYHSKTLKPLSFQQQVILLCLQVITITLSITFSATVALMLLFWPKAYIIVWKPERNNRGAFTTTTEVRCHVGQRSFVDKSTASRKYS